MVWKNINFGQSLLFALLSQIFMTCRYVTPKVGIHLGVFGTYFLVPAHICESVLESWETLLACSFSHALTLITSLGTRSWHPSHKIRMHMGFWGFISCSPIHFLSQGGVFGLTPCALDFSWLVSLVMP